MALQAVSYDPKLRVISGSNPVALPGILALAESGAKHSYSGQGITIDGLPGAGGGAGGFYTMDAAIASGGAFLVGELEKRNPELHEPLFDVTWPRDITPKEGGGAIEVTSDYFVDYRTPGTNQFGLMTGTNNVIGRIQANITKDTWKVFPWGIIQEINFFNQAKMAEVGRSLPQILQKGVHLSYDKTLDQNVYLGFSNVGTTGLVNSTQVPSALAAAGVSTSRLWAQKTPQEIVNDITTGILTALATAQYSRGAIVTQMLIPWAQYNQINSQPMVIGGVPINETILEYVLKHNLAENQGRPFTIQPCRQCIGQGAGATDRAVFYVNEPDFVCFDIPMPLRPMMTGPNMQHFSYETLYFGTIGQVKFLDLHSPFYMDGI